MADEQRLIIKTIADTKGFTNGLNRMQSSLKKLSGVFSAVGGAYAASRIFNIAKDLVNTAAELETVNRSFERTFSDLAGSVEDNLNQVADQIGRSTTSLKKGAISFNAFFKGLGFASKEAANLSVSMQLLSLDLASFFGIQDTNAQKRFIAALAGSPEVLDQYGINLKQTALQQELYNMGLKTTVQNTNEVIKTQARLNVIQRAMTSAGIIGDAQRAVFTYAGQIKSLEGNFLKLKENIGGALKPLASFIVSIADTVISDGNDDIQDLVDGVTRLRKILGTDDELKFIRAIADNRDEILGLSKEYLKNLEKQPEHQRVLNALGREEYENYRAILDLFKTIQTVGVTNADTAKLQVYLSNQLKAINEKIGDQEKEQKTILETITKESEKRIESLHDELKFKKDLEAIDKLKYRDLLDQEKLHSGITNEMAMQYRNGIITEEVYKRQEKILARIQAALARKTASKEAPTLMKKGGDELLEVEEIKLDELIPKEISEGKERIFNWESVFDNTGFLEQLTIFEETLKGSIEVFDRLRFDFVNGVKQMGLDLAAGLSGGFASAVSETLNGNKKFVDALRIATKRTLIAQSADLAAQAMYYGILGTALLIAGTFAAKPKLAAEGVGYLKAAAVMGGGAAILGATGKSIKGEAGLGVNGTGGNGNDGIGSKGGTFTDFMNAIQGEQVFRLAGNDLVTAINRNNTFQGSIGG